MAPEQEAEGKKSFEFVFNGRPVQAYDGDTIAIALARAGLRIFSRSMKFHRPRGLYCGSGRCLSCVMRVNGVPGVRTCTVPAVRGMVVRTERGFPRTHLDVFSLFDHIFRKEFDYHSRFVRPAFLAPFYQYVVRHLASSSRMPDAPGTFPPFERKTCEILIVGRGMSGSLAQARMQRAGMRSIIVADRRVGHEDVPSIAFGLYESGEVGIQSSSGVQLVKARTILLATGRSETGLPIVNGDIPGNMLPEGVSQLVSRGINPGPRAVLVGRNELRNKTMRQLQAVRTSVVGEFELSDVLRVIGSRCVRGVEVRKPNGSTERISCELVVQLGALVPSVELAQQAGCELRSEKGLWSVKVDAEGRTSVPGVYACGGLTGLVDEQDRMASGETVALTILRSRGGA